MKHIKRILAGIIIAGTLFCPAIGFAENLTQALNDSNIQSEKLDNTLTQVLVEGQKNQAKKVLKEFKKQLRQIEEEKQAKEEQKRIEEEQRQEEERKQQLSSVGASIVAASYNTPSPGAGLCAAWVCYVYENAGYGQVSGNACDQYWNWCKSTDRNDIVEGMLIAVPSHSQTSAGAIYGHVGIIVEHDGQFYVRHNIGYVTEDSLDYWISFYGTTYQPAWGFANGIG